MAQADAAQVARTGTFVIKLTVVEKSGGLSKPYCGAQVYHYGIGNVSNKQVFFSEEGSGSAAGAASPWTCTIKLPYNWPAANDANQVYVRVHVQSGNSSSVILLARKVSQDFTEVNLPANNKTTTLTKTIYY